jgi:hypothetical protein
MITSDRRQVRVGLLCVVLNSLYALAGESSEVRVLHFAKDHSLGMLGWYT